MVKVGMSQEQCLEVESVLQYQFGEFFARPSWIYNDGRMGYRAGHQVAVCLKRADRDYLNSDQRTRPPRE